MMMMMLKCVVVVVVVVVVFAQKKNFRSGHKIWYKMVQIRTNNFSVKIREQQKQQNYRG